MQSSWSVNSEADQANLGLVSRGLNLSKWALNPDTLTSAPKRGLPSRAFCYARNSAIAKKKKKSPCICLALVLLLCPSGRKAPCRARTTPQPHPGKQTPVRGPLPLSERPVELGRKTRHSPSLLLTLPARKPHLHPHTQQHSPTSPDPCSQQVPSPPDPASFPSGRPLCPAGKP